MVLWSKRTIATMEQLWCRGVSARLLLWTPSIIESPARYRFTAYVLAVTQQSTFEFCECAITRKLKIEATLLY